MLLIVLVVLPYVLGLNCPTCQDKLCDKENSIAIHECRLPSTVYYLPHTSEYRMVLDLGPKYYQCIDLEYLQGNESKRVMGCEIVDAKHNSCKLWRKKLNVTRCNLSDEKEIIDITAKENNLPKTTNNTVASERKNMQVLLTTENAENSSETVQAVKDHKKDIKKAKITENTTDELGTTSPLEKHKNATENRRISLAILTILLFAIVAF